MGKWSILAVIVGIALILSISLPGYLGSAKGRPPHEATSPPKQALTIWWAQWDPSVGLQELGLEYEKATGVKVSVP